MQTPEQFVNAQRAMLELAQKVGARAFEGASQLYELNMKTAQAAFAEMPSRLQQGATSAAQPAAMQPDLTRFASYAQQAATIVSSTGMEIAAMLQQSANEQFGGVGRLGEGQASAFGTEPFIEAARRSYETAQQAIAQVWGGPGVASATPAAPASSPAPTKRAPA